MRKNRRDGRRVEKEEGRGYESSGEEGGRGEERRGRLSETHLI